MAESTKTLPNGPQPGVTYPLKVIYCGNCSLPLEYCEYYPEYDRCKAWLQQYLPSEFEKLSVSGGSIDDDNSEEKKRQKRGGKGKLLSSLCINANLKKIELISILLS